jgi:Zn finger protein HypA/HybF involved in hydrogenase expression
MSNPLFKCRVCDERLCEKQGETCPKCEAAQNEIEVKKEEAIKSLDGEAYDPEQ